MKTTVKSTSTKRRTFILFNGQVFETNNDWTNTDFKSSDFYKGDESFFNELGEASTIEEAYQLHINTLKSVKEDRQLLKDADKSKFEAIISNTQNHTPSEIWRAVKWYAKQGAGWSATDILLANNPLSALLIKKLGSYTVSAFDDNSIMIKAGSKRYGTLRKWLSVEDLITE
jgi:hypothetical protein